MSYRENMSNDALAAWDRLVSQYGDLKINSAYRDPAHNARVGGAKKSQHTHGNAFDVDVSGMPRDERLGLIQAARGAGFQGIGVYDNALHFDVGPSRAWGADYTRNSLPAWSAEAVGAPVGHFPGDGHDHGAPQYALAGGFPSAPEARQGNALSAASRPPMNALIDPSAFMVNAAPARKISFT